MGVLVPDSAAHSDDGETAADVGDLETEKATTAPNAASAKRGKTASGFSPSSVSQTPVAHGEDGGGAQAQEGVAGRSAGEVQMQRQQQQRQQRVVTAAERRPVRREMLPCVKAYLQSLGLGAVVRDFEEAHEDDVRGETFAQYAPCSFFVENNPFSIPKLFAVLLQLKLAIASG